MRTRGRSRSFPPSHRGIRDDTSNEQHHESVEKNNDDAKPIAIKEEDIEQQPTKVPQADVKQEDDVQPKSTPPVVKVEEVMEVSNPPAIAIKEEEEEAKDILAVKRKVGRPSKSNKDTRNDVLYAKGAAAQTMTNPGNLLYYQLCEQRYNEFTQLNDIGSKKQLCREVVDTITATGGCFRGVTGARLKCKAAVDKTYDRFRQIGKPKLRPTGFTDNDVVTARGAAIHLYPGNGKWHTLVEGYVLSYYREIVNDKGLYDEAKAEAYEQKCRKEEKSNTKAAKRGKGGKFTKGSFCKKRPDYQTEVIEKVMKTVHDRGGKFRNESRAELSHKQAVDKTYLRFKDCKVLLKSGKKKFVDATKVKVEEIAVEHVASANAASSLNNDAVMKKEEDGKDGLPDNHTAATITGTTIFQKRLGGFSTVHATVSTRNDMLAYKRGKGRVRRGGWTKGEWANQHSSSRGTKRKYDSDDDEESFHSDMLSDGDKEDGDGDDNDDSSLENGEEDNNGNMSDSSEDERVVSRKRAANNRAERTKRRQSGIPSQHEPPSNKTPKKKKTVPPPKEEEAAPDHPLSEYEMYRLEKIQRNKAKLAALGL